MGLEAYYFRVFEERSMELEKIKGAAEATPLIYLMSAVECKTSV